MATLTIVAPLSGQVWPLERVPDPVFAQKLVGDGLSIDPIDGLLLSGCEGHVSTLHDAGHAVTVRTPSGVEVLLHVGIDTVMLKGQGFDPREEPAHPDRHFQQRDRDVVGARDRVRPGGKGHAPHADGRCTRSRTFGNRDACAETRLRLVLRDGRKVQEQALRAEGITALATIDSQTLHLLAGRNADQYAAEMRGLLAAAE
jgi:glucose-specific phosphotransferase system IIA component